MKTLRKIRLKEAVIISDSEMRQIRGGMMLTTPSPFDCTQHHAMEACQSDHRKCTKKEGEGICAWLTGINPVDGKCTCV